MASSKTSFVYAIGERNCEAVKVGVARNVEERLRALQLANPNELFIHASMPGGRQEEAAVHWMFATCRIRGEWFKNTNNQIVQWLNARAALIKSNAAAEKPLPTEWLFVRGYEALAQKRAPKTMRASTNRSNAHVDPASTLETLKTLVANRHTLPIGIRIDQDNWIHTTQRRLARAGNIPVARINQELKSAAVNGFIELDTSKNTTTIKLKT